MQAWYFTMAALGVQCILRDGQHPVLGNQGTHRYQGRGLGRQVQVQDTGFSVLTLGIHGCIWKASLYLLSLRRTI